MSALRSVSTVSAYEFGFVFGGHSGYRKGRRNVDLLNIRGNLLVNCLPFFREWTFRLDIFDYTNLLLLIVSVCSSASFDDPTYARLLDYVGACSEMLLVLFGIFASCVHLERDFALLQWV